MDQQPRIILDPNILVGKPIIRGTRLAVEFIIDLLAQGWSTDENFPLDAVEALRQQKHDMVWIRTESPGIPDPDMK